MLKIKNKLIICFSLLIAIIIGILIFLLIPKNKNWLQKGKKVYKGSESYSIGEYYEYDETNDGKIKGLTDVNWKVLGVDEKGNLLIISASSVDQVTLGKKDDIETTKKDYKEGISRLNNIASKYGKGKKALDARSVKFDDINKITGYDKDSMLNYNINITYYWGDAVNPIAQVEDGEMLNIKVNHNNQFTWYDKETGEWLTSIKNETNSLDTEEKIVTLKNELVMYDNYIHNEEYFLLEEDSLEYNMLYFDDNKQKAQYWLADMCINATEKYVGHGYNVVRGPSVNYSNLLYSSLNIYEITSGVRVVVTIG